MSRYTSYEALRLEKEQGIDYDIHTLNRRSPLVIAAPHGGGIEPGTSEIALALAGQEYSYYVFDGLGERGNHELHIASTDFDEPRCLELLQNACLVLTVHGCRGGHEVVYVGGLDKGYMSSLEIALSGAGFCVDIDDSRRSGKSPSNICNRSRSGMGVQLEISLGMRRKMFKGLRQEQRVETTPVFDRFITAVRRIF